MLLFGAVGLEHLVCILFFGVPLEGACFGGISLDHGLPMLSVVAVLGSLRGSGVPDNSEHRRRVGRGGVVITVTGLTLRKKSVDNKSKDVW